MIQLLEGKFFFSLRLSMTSLIKMSFISVGHLSNGVMNVYFYCIILSELQSFKKRKHLHKLNLFEICTLSVNPCSHNHTCSLIFCYAIRHDVYSKAIYTFLKSKYNYHLHCDINFIQW